MIYEIVNPSDAYTIAANDHAVAAVACFLLSNGQYAFEPVDGTEEMSVPIFMFGGADDWCREHFDIDATGLIMKVMDEKRAELIACLESCLIGNEAAREEFDVCCSFIDEDSKRAAFKIARHEKRRTSMNDIGSRAYRMASKLKQETKP